MRNLNKLYGGSEAKATSLNPSGKRPGCGDRLELPPSQAQVEIPQLQAQLVCWLWPSTHSAGPSTVLKPAKGWCSWVQRWQQDTLEKSVLLFCGYRGDPLFLGNLTINFQALWSAVFPSWPKYYSTCKDNRASVTESTITIELLMIHEYTRTKYAFSLILSGTGFSILVLLGDFSTLTPNS